MKPLPPSEIAARMVKRYGRGRALEYAAGYATGVYFEQHAAGREYWLEVHAEIDKLPRGDKP